MAGEHKCPLCESTFTRPQHVGRHLRSHTGDRPYECKECPLRFARSDLLSRHVNKAHRAAEPGAEPKKAGKKGRRKSLPSSARQATAESSGSGGSGDPGPSGSGQEVNENGVKPGQEVNTGESARRASFGQHPPQLQAQAMYPNHPLLAGTPPPMPWATAGVNGMTGSPINHFQHPMLGSTPNTATGFHMGMAPSMTWSATDMGVSSSSMGRNDSGLSSQYEYGVKKRACDQCNHSKVKCDCGHPCNRCTARNVGCSYNKTPKSRTSSLTPGMSYSGMPTGNSMSPVSTFSTSPYVSTSPIAMQQTHSNQLGQYSASPTHVGSFGLPLLQQQANLGQWTGANTFDLSGVEPSLGNSDPSQALGMYLAPAPVQMQNPQSNGNGVPITQHYNGQMANGQSFSPPARPTLAPTPSLTASHATSPSSSDELADRKPSLISSITSMDYPGQIPVKSLSYSSENSNTAFKQVSPDAKQYMLPPQAPFEQADLMSYQWPNTAYTIDPRYQIRQSLAQSDDENDQGPKSGTFPLPTDADEPLLNARRRSSVGIWANTFNQMTLQDGSLANQTMLPDPYTAVQVAHQVANVRPSFPMTTVMEGTEPSKMPSFSDVRDVWKQFIHEPPAGSTPKQEKREGESSVTSSASRPGMGRAMSKSNSMPDLTSPSLHATSFSYNNVNGTEHGAHQVPANVQALPMQHGTTLPASDSTRQTWHNEIQQRQAGFTMQPGGRFGRHSVDSNGSMLPPSTNNRPVASIMQYSGALQQTLAPERAPSFGLTPNIEKANPTGSTLRTPSKLSQRTTVTSATARPGNKRLPSQTLVPEAKKRSASFSVYDETDDGILGDTEDDGTGGAGWNMAAYQNVLAYQNMANLQHSVPLPLPMSGQAHGRSASLSGIEGWDMSMFGYQPNPTAGMVGMGAGAIGAAPAAPVGPRQM